MVYLSGGKGATEQNKEEIRGQIAEMRKIIEALLDVKFKKRIKFDLKNISMRGKDAKLFSLEFSGRALENMRLKKNLFQIKKNGKRNKFFLTNKHIWMLYYKFVQTIKNSE